MKERQIKEGEIKTIKAPEENIDNFLKFFVFLNIF
jgi:hypothetical protein